MLLHLGGRLGGQEGRQLLQVERLVLVGDLGKVLSDNISTFLVGDATQRLNFHFTLVHVINGSNLFAHLEKLAWVSLS